MSEPTPEQVSKERIRDALAWVAQESRALLLLGHIDERKTRRLRMAFEQLDAAYEAAP